MESKFTLSNHPKIASGFKVPDGYFDQFPDQLMEKIPTQEVRVIAIKSTPKRWYLVAASLVVGVLSLTLYQHYQRKMQEVDATTLENYLAYHASLSEEEIVNLLDEKDLEKMKLDLNIADKDLQEALDDTPNIEQYLID